jgi:hypothetical protein
MLDRTLILLGIKTCRLTETFEIYTNQRRTAGLRKNLSTADAIFIMRQIVEKSIEFNHPAYLCFVDLKKAFDQVGLADVTEGRRST